MRQGAHTVTKIPFIYSFFGNSAASAPISTFMCLWAIYIVLGSVYIFPSAEKGDRSWEYINRSQTHKCGNWDWDPDSTVLEIFVSKFRYFVFAVQFTGSGEPPEFYLYRSVHWDGAGGTDPIYVPVPLHPVTQGIPIERFYIWSRQLVGGGGGGAPDRIYLTGKRRWLKNLTSTPPHWP
jgi:hypothetical protein